MCSLKKTPYKIGVTGGIATGKSLVRNIMESFDIVTIDADEIVHDILQNDQLVIGQIVDMFGKFVLKEDGGVNRKELAKIVFSDPAKLAKLESIVHPQTYRLVKEFMVKSDADIVAAIIPLLLENYRQHMFDEVWLVVSEEKSQIERLQIRDDMPEEEARQRIASQMPQNIKVALADKIIDNNGDVKEVEQQVKELVEGIRSRLDEERSSNY